MSKHTTRADLLSVVVSPGKARTAVLLALGLAMLASTTGCAAARRDVRATGEPDSYAKLGYRLAWGGFPLMERGGRVARVAAMDDIFLVQTKGGAVTAIETDTGRTRWATPLGGATTNFVGLGRAGDRILVASDTDLYIFNAVTGGQEDRHEFAVIASTPPAVVGDFAVFGSVTGQAFGHDLVTGFKSWGYTLHGSVRAAPVATNDVVFVASEGGDVIVLDPASGSSVGRDRIFGGTASNPVAGSGAFFLASLDQAMYAFSAADGRMLWRRLSEQPIRSQPSLVDGVVYVDIPGEGLVAINSTTGSDLWTSPDASGRVVGKRAGRLIVWTGAGALLVNTRTGAVEDRAPLPALHDLIMSPNVDGDLYAVAAQGVVTKYAPRN